MAMATGERERENVSKLLKVKQLPTKKQRKATVRLIKLECTVCIYIATTVIWRETEVDEYFLFIGCETLL